MPTPIWVPAPLPWRYQNTGPPCLPSALGGQRLPSFHGEISPVASAGRPIGFPTTGPPPTAPPLREIPSQAGYRHTPHLCLPAQTQAGRSASSACTGPAAAQNISLPVKTPPKTDILPPEFSYAKASLLIPAPHLFCIIYWNLLHEEILTKLIVRACPGLFAMGQLLLCRQLPGAIVRLFGAKGAIPEAPAIFTALLCQFANV